MLRSTEKMVFKCEVEWCRIQESNKPANVKLMSFPSDGRRRHWVERVKGKDSTWNPDSASKLCTLHFDAKWFHTKPHNEEVLLPGAIPKWCLLPPEGRVKLECRENPVASPSDESLSSAIRNSMLVNEEWKGLGWKGLQHVDLGLANLRSGGGAVRNACIQALFHTPLFLRWLENEKKCSEQCRCLKCLLQDLLQAMRREDIDMQNICDILDEIQMSFLSGYSMEPFSFLLGLLTRLHHNYLDGQQVNLSLLVPSQDEITPILAIFGGTLKTVSDCLQCHMQTSEIQQMLCLQVDIENVKSIQEAVNKTLESTSHKTVWCESCKKLSDQKVFTKFGTHPAVLCVKLKRFSLCGEKIRTHVGISHILTLPNGNKYNLISALMHTGETTAETQALVKCPNGSLLLMNDTLIQRKSYGATMAGAMCYDVYMLFYAIEPQKVVTSVDTLSEIQLEQTEDDPTESVESNMLACKGSEESEIVIAAPEYAADPLELLDVSASPTPPEVQEFTAVSTHNSWKVTMLSESHKGVKSCSSSHTSVPSMTSVDMKKRGHQMRGKRIHLRKKFNHLAVLSYEKACFILQDRHFIFLTGISKYNFNVLYTLLGGNQKIKRLNFDEGYKTSKTQLRAIKLSSRSRLLLMLIRLKRGFTVKDLSVLFNVSVSQVKKIWCTMLKTVFFFLTGYSKTWFNRAKTRKEEKPSPFIAFPNLIVIIEGAEFQVKKLKGTERVHSSTMRCIVGTSCWGDVIYVSPCYEGNKCYKEIIQDCGFLDLLEKGDAVMECRDFDILSDLKGKGVELIQPPCVGASNYFGHQQEVLMEASLASKVCAKKAVETFKYWRLLRFPIPMSLLSSLSEMVYVAASLSNGSPFYAKQK